MDAVHARGRRMGKCILAQALLLAMGAAQAAEPACQTNFKQEGSFFAGRRFSTNDLVPGVAPAVAFKRIYTEGIKSGLTVGSSDKDIGVIAFVQKNGGVTSNGQNVDLPWNVSIDAEGDGSRISVTKSTPGGYATSQDFQIKSMCAVIDAARQ